MRDLLVFIFSGIVWLLIVLPFGLALTEDHVGGFHKTILALLCLFMLMLLYYFVCKWTARIIDYYYYTKRNRRKIVDMSDEEQMIYENIRILNSSVPSTKVIAIKEAFRKLLSVRYNLDDVELNGSTFTGIPRRP
jgi:predicted membrane protein